MTAASPLEVLWAVDGRPPLPSANTAGVCAATGAQADVVPLKAGLPSSFNSQHLLRFAGPTAGVSASMHHAMTTWGPVRCADSRWKNSGLMALVIDDHNVTEVTRWQGDPFTVADLLDDLHLLDAMAIVAPTTRKKHSTLWAQFGHVATESGPERFTAPLIAATRAVRDAIASGCCAAASSSTAIAFVRCASICRSDGTRISTNSPGVAAASAALRMRDRVSVHLSIRPWNDCCTTHATRNAATDGDAVRFFERSAPMTPDQAASATGSTYGPLDPDDPLPWDFVVTHHDRGFLVDRWRKRQAFLNQQVARR